MIGTSFGEWLLIRLAVVAFRYTPLIAVGLIILLVLCRPTGAPWVATSVLALNLYLLAECLFYVTVYWPYARTLQRPAVYPAPLTAPQRRALFARCFENVPSVERYLSWWCLGADSRDIWRDNVQDFLLWAFFETGAELDRQPDEETQRELEGYVQAIEARLGRPLKPGKGPARSLRLTIDEVRTTYRSVLWYGVVFMVDQLTHLLMWWKGFQYHAAKSQQVFPPRPQRWLAKHRSPIDTVSYWHSPHHASGKRPVVFFHGIGIGLLVYIRYLAKLATDDEAGVGVIAVENLSVSFRLTSPPAARAAFLDQMTRILDHHGWQQVALAAHSYGSVPVTHMLRSGPLSARVSAIVLIDPVTIMLHLPDVAYNFTRRPPQRANEWQLWYFASTDPGVACCLGRHFFWRDNIVWRDELLGGGRRVAVFLSGRDLISDTAAIARYLRARRGDGDDDGDEDGRAPLDVTMFPTLDHAQVFDAPQETQQVVEATRACCSVRGRT